MMSSLSPDSLKGFSYRRINFVKACLCLLLFASALALAAPPPAQENAAAALGKYATTTHLKPRADILLQKRSDSHHTNAHSIKERAPPSQGPPSTMDLVKCFQTRTDFEKIPLVFYSGSENLLPARKWAETKFGKDKFVTWNSLLSEAETKCLYSQKWTAPQLDQIAVRTSKALAMLARETYWIRAGTVEPSSGSYWYIYELPTLTRCRYARFVTEVRLPSGKSQILWTKGAKPIGNEAPADVKV